MNPSKRLPLLLLCSALLLSAACKSESRPAANANVEPTPPPGMAEMSTATLKKDVEQNPEDLVARYNLGTFYFAEGKYAEASEQFKFVVENKPDDVEALDKLGMSYAAANRFDEAADAFQRALRLQPENAAYYHQALADVYEKSGKTAEAAGERAAFQKLDPNVRVKVMFRAGKYEEAAAEARKVSPPNAETQFILGDALFKLKRAGEALDAYKEAVRLNPKYGEAYFQMGNAYDLLNRQEEAAKAFQAAARLNPQDADAFYNLGNTYNKLNRPPEAARAFAEAVRLRPDDAEARLRLAEAELKQGNAAAAREQQEQLRKLAPEAAQRLQQAIDQSPNARP